MYHHVKKLMYTVHVNDPSPRFGNMLLEQFGGANGELAAAMQYSIQGLNCEDPGTRDALQFLMTREITHMKVFMAALDSMGKDPLSIGNIPPTPGIVDEYYNDSTGEGDDGEIDARGPWNKGGDWKYVEAPAFGDSGKASADKSMGSAKSAPTKKRSSK